MRNGRAARGTKAALMAGLGLAPLVDAAPAPAYVVEAVTTISAAHGEDRSRLEDAIQAAIDEVATHAVAFTPTVVALIDARLVGDRIFLFVLLADRDGERAIKVLLEERREAREAGRRSPAAGRPDDL